MHCRRYFQITEDNEGIYADKISTKLVRCFDKALTEGFGMLKIPFVIVILGIAHLALYGLIEIVLSFQVLHRVSN